MSPFVFGHGSGVFVLCDSNVLHVRSGASVESEDALVVAAVVAAGGGNAGAPERADDQWLGNRTLLVCFNQNPRVGLDSGRLRVA